MLDDRHPSLLRFDAARAESEVDLVRLDADSALTASLSLELRAADKLITPDTEFDDDSRSLLTIDKPLTRFGQDRALRSGLKKRLLASDQLQKYGRSMMRITIMQAFFDVLAADYAYAAANEEMTLAYLEFQDMEERKALDEVSEIEVLEKQTEYLDAFSRREIIASEQRASRLRMALAVNRQDATPGILLEPDLSVYERVLPEYEILIEQVLENNPEIQASQLRYESATKEFQIRSGWQTPTLGVRLQAADYASERSVNRDRYRASVYLDIPLTHARNRQGDIAELKARVLQYEAEFEALQHQYRVETLELLQQLKQLQLEKQAAEAELLFREVALDKVRLQYEMEVRARIGRANTQVAKALSRLANVKFDLALAWERIDALAGNEPVVFN